MKRLALMLIVLAVCTAAGANADLPKGPPAQNLIMAPCHKCA